MENARLIANMVNQAVSLRQMAMHIQASQYPTVAARTVTPRPRLIWYARPVVAATPIDQDFFTGQECTSDQVEYMYHPLEHGHSGEALLSTDQDVFMLFRTWESETQRYFTNT